MMSPLHYIHIVLNKYLGAACNVPRALYSYSVYSVYRIAYSFEGKKNYK